MVVFMCVMAAIVPLEGVGVVIAEARRTRRWASVARDSVRILEMVQATVGRPID
jgi:hypothetical protein